MLILLFLAGIFIQHGAAECDLSDEHNGYCFTTKVDERRTWQEAEMFCIQEGPGGHLASIESQEDEDYILSKISSYKNKQPYLWVNVWLGLNYPEGAQGDKLGDYRTGWTWSDGKAYNYQAWGPQAPSPGDKFAMLSNGSWVGTPDNNELANFICKRSELTAKPVIDLTAIPQPELRTTTVRHVIETSRHFIPVETTTRIPDETKLTTTLPLWVTSQPATALTSVPTLQTNPATSKYTHVPRPTPAPTTPPTLTPLPTFTPQPTLNPIFTPVPTSNPTFTPEPTPSPSYKPVPTSSSTLTPEPTRPTSTPVLTSPSEGSTLSPAETTSIFITPTYRTPTTTYRPTIYPLPKTTTYPLHHGSLMSEVSARWLAPAIVVPTVSLILIAILICILSRRCSRNNKENTTNDIPMAVISTGDYANQTEPKRTHVSETSLSTIHTIERQQNFVNSTISSMLDSGRRRPVQPHDKNLYENVSISGYMPQGGPRRTRGVSNNPQGQVPPISEDEYIQSYENSNVVEELRTRHQMLNMRQQHAAAAADKDESYMTYQNSLQRAQVHV